MASRLRFSPGIVALFAGLLPLTHITLFAQSSHSVAKGAEMAAADSVHRVWPAEPPSWTAPSQSEHDTSGSDGRMVAGKPVIRLGYVSEPQLHVYQANPENRSDTTIIICPGGGYSILAWDLEGTEIAELLQQIGVTAVVLKYRVPSRGEAESWKPAVQDIQRSISLIRGGALPGVASKQIGVLGFSAGGNASARAATASERFYSPIDAHDSNRFEPDFAVLVYPAWLVESEDPTKLVDGIKVTEQTPPMFFAHARDDRISCLNSVTMFTKLQQRDKASALHIFADGGHGFGARPNDQATDAWPELLHLWMRDRGWLAQ